MRFEVGSPRAFINMATLLLSFSSAALLLLYVLALWTRLRSGVVRFYDLLFPATVIFFEFFQNDAGQQYGPRYWFSAWPTIALAIGSTLSTRSLSAEYHDFVDIVAQAPFALRPAGTFSPLKRPLSRQWRVHLPTLAAAQLVGYLSFAVVFAAVLRDYVDASAAAAGCRSHSKPRDPPGSLANAAILYRCKRLHPEWVWLQRSRTLWSRR